LDECAVAMRFSPQKTSVAYMPAEARRFMPSSFGGNQQPSALVLHRLMNGVDSDRPANPVKLSE
jgi:hypothetical protein